MTSTQSTAPPLGATRQFTFPTRDQRSQRTAELLVERASAVTPAERDAINAEIVEVNRAVAVALARRYRNRGVDFEDLCQTAFEGLTKAVIRFDSDLADDLLSFAVPTIRGELLRHFRDQAWSIRPPRRIQELRQRMGPAGEELRAELGRDPSRAELAARLDVEEADVEEAMHAGDCFQPLSLAQPTTHSSTLTIADLLCEDDDWNDMSDARMSLIPAVRKLGERDRRILYLRFFEDYTQAEIGEELGVSQMQVSRLLSRLLGRLREEIA